MLFPSSLEESTDISFVVKLVISRHSMLINAYMSVAL